MNGIVCWALTFTKQDVAAWVQAIGSIAAILGASYIANRQRRDEICHRKQEYKKSRIGVARQIVHLASFASWPHAQDPANFTTELKLKLAKELDVERQERRLRYFESFPIFEVKDSMPMTHMFRMSENWYEGIRRMKRAKELALAGDITWESAFDDLASFPPASERVKGWLTKYVISVLNDTYQDYDLTKEPKDFRF